MSLNFLNKMLFPQGIKCIVCDSELPLPTPDGVCGKCNLIKNVHFCSHCGRAYPVKKDLLTDTSCQTEQELSKKHFVCPQCVDYPLAFTRAAAPYVYKGDAVRLVYKLKYGNSPYLCKYMASFMAQTYNKLGFEADFITFVPMAKRRQTRRGYNQAEILANEIGKALNLPVFGALKRDKHYKSITKLTRRGRIKSIMGSISLLNGLGLHGQSVLLIDDVFTSGTTANFAAKTLLEGGAKQVYVLTFATSYCRGFKVKP